MQHLSLLCLRQITISIMLMNWVAAVAGAAYLAPSFRHPVTGDAMVTNVKSTAAQSFRKPHNLTATSLELKSMRPQRAL